MVKNLPANAVDVGSIPGSGRSPRVRSGNSLQYSCLGNAIDRGGWWTPVHGVTKESDMTQQLNNNFLVNSPHPEAIKEPPRGASLKHK